MFALFVPLIYEVAFAVAANEDFQMRVTSNCTVLPLLRRAIVATSLAFDFGIHRSPRLFENNQHAREWCAVRGVTEFQPAFNEANFRRVRQYPLVKPSRIGSRRDEEHRQFRLFLATPEPARHAGTVWRITEHPMPTPLLKQRRQSVNRTAKWTRVQREAEFPVKLLVDSLWRRPLNRC